MPNPKTLNEMYSVVSYTGNGALKEFSVPFPYLYREDIHVYFINYDEYGNEVRTELKVYPLVQSTLPPSTFDVYFLSEATLKFVIAPAEGHVIEIRRITNRLESEVVFSNSSVLTEADLNLLSTQLLYIVQEAYDNQTLIQTEIEKFSEEKLEATLNAAERADASAKIAEAGRQEVVATKGNAIAILTSEGTVQVERVEEAGDYQLERIEGLANVAGLANGIACASQVWKLTEDIPAGSTITLPRELRYIPKRHHLWLSYGGIVLSPTFFEEVGNGATPSREFITKVTFKAGQELMAWVIPLGKAYEVELTSRIAALEERVAGFETAIADLSRSVVYADPENNL